MHYFVGQENEDNYGDTDEDLECTEGKDGDCLVTTNFCNGFALKTKVRACPAKIVPSIFSEFSTTPSAPARLTGSVAGSWKMEVTGDHLLLTGIKHLLISVILRNFRVSSCLHQGGMGCQGT